MYDPALGKFISSDPLSEKFNFQSPYVYAINNPVRFTDFLGLGPEDEVEKDKNEENSNGTEESNNKVKLTDITVTNKDGEEITITVKFKNTSDKKSSDNEVDKDLKKVFEGAIKEAAKQTDITEVTITSTTNGKHSADSRHSSGKALDIGAINGKSVTDIGNNDPVKALQNAFENQTGARENFGPSMMKKSGSDYIHSNLSETQKTAREKVETQHKNHIHWSID